MTTRAARFSLLSLALVVFWLAPVPRASAQVAEEEASAAARARDEFTAGEAAYAEERYAEALEHFLAAQTLDPHDVVRFNVAVCLQRLGRWSDAWSEYRSLAESAELDDTQREYARSLLADLEARLAVLRVTASEAAEVRVDGSAVGAAPIELRLAPGPHVVSARAGEREVTRRVTVERGEAIDLALELPAAEAIAAPPRPTRRVMRDPDVLTWVGSGLAAVGLGGTIGFGLYANDLHAEYTDRLAAGTATDAQAEKGNLYVTLTNVSITALAVGLTLIAVDVVLLLAGEGSREVEVTE